MNVFVLCTGRSGSASFIEASKHITNFTAGHETRVERYGADRLEYPNDHIEADNRLSWFLGPLGKRWGDASFVHLTRDTDATAQSLLRRWNRGIMRAYHGEILMHLNDRELDDDARLAICRDYCDTVNANIAAFLESRRHIAVRLESIDADFPAFWEFIGAQGDLAAAMDSWNTPHNVSRPDEPDLPSPEQRRIQVLESALAARDERIVKLEAERVTVTARFQRDVDVREERIAKLEADRNSLKERPAHDVDKRDGRIAKLEADRDELTARITETRRRLEADRETLKARLDKALAQSAERRDVIAAKNERIDRLEAARARLQAKIETR